MLAGRFILELLILTVSGLGSGLFIVRRYRCHPVEKLCLVIAVSWTVVYIAGTAIYLAHLPIAWHFAVSGASLILLIVVFGEFRSLWHSRQVRLTAYGFIFLYFWNLLMLSLIRQYSGGSFAGDWYEHYHRALFFAQYLPKDTKFLTVYDLPARPPMMNMLGAHVLAQVGIQYDLFQPAAAYFNLLIYFPCALLLGALARRGRRLLPLMIVLFAASPVLVENVTYTWTKLFAGFFILLGTWLYLRGYQKQDGFRIVAAFASLCVGMLVHYSTGPYLLFFTLHYACTCWRRKNVIVEAAAIAAICLPILATWFAWSFYFYGWKTTVASNTSVSGTEQFSVSGNLQKIGANIVSTVFPHPLHISRHGFDKDYYQPNDLGYLRDYWFLILQPTFPAAIGTLGGLVALYILCKKLKILPPAQSIFWGTFVVFCALVGIAAHGEPDPMGVGHICLLPLSILGVAFLAANFLSLPVWVRALVAVFAIFDFSVGVFLHIRMEQIYFDQIVINPGPIILIPLTSQLLSSQAVFNSLWRAQQHLPYWADHFQSVAVWLEFLIILCMSVLLHPLAMAIRGQPIRFRRRPDWVFYPLLFLLVALALYCSKDLLDGSAEAARQQLATPMDQLKQEASDAYQAAQANPESSADRVALGEAAYRTGDAQAATDILAEAFAMDLSNLQARYDALLLFNTYMPFTPQGRTLLAVAEAVWENPDSATYRQRLGILLIQHHHSAQAVAQLNEAVQLTGGNSPDALVLLGIAYEQFGTADGLSKSIQCFGQALHLRPDSADIEGAFRKALQARGDSDAQINILIQQARGGP